MTPTPRIIKGMKVEWMVQEAEGERTLRGIVLDFDRTGKIAKIQGEGEGVACVRCRDLTVIGMAEGIETDGDLRGASENDRFEGRRDELGRPMQSSA